MNPGHRLAGREDPALAPDGSIPWGNAFPESPVWSYEHRNPQDRAWQPGTGRLFATEQGTGGVNEVNLIEPAANFGWPVEREGRSHPPFTTLS